MSHTNLAATERQTAPDFKITVRVEFAPQEPIKPFPWNTRFFGSLVDSSIADAPSKTIAQVELDLSGKTITEANPLIFELVPPKPLSIEPRKYHVQGILNVAWIRETGSIIRSGDYMSMTINGLPVERLEGKDKSVFSLKLDRYISKEQQR